ncbi:MAG: DUF6311 domain-containing protein [Pseudomonadota bacterium]
MAPARDPGGWTAAGIGALAGAVAFALCLLRADGPVLHDALAGDIAQSAAGAAAYARDAWRLPLFAVEGLSGVPGQNIVFSDSAPLFALPWKLFGGGATAPAVFMHLLLAAAFLLQGVAGALAVQRIVGPDGTRGTALAALALGGLILALWPAFLHRHLMQHTGLGHHWVLVMALTPVLMLLAGRRPARPVAEYAALTLAAAWLHPYLLAFAALAGGLFFAGRALGEAPAGARPALIRAAFGLGAILAVALVAMGLGGHWMVPSVSGGAYITAFSLNLAAPFMPAELSIVVPDWAAFPESQFAAYAYIGLGGGLLALGAVIAWARSGRLAVAGAGGALALTFAAAALVTLIALSRDIRLAETTLLAYPLPAWAETLLSTFRAVGRWSWIPGYLLLLAALTAALRLGRAGLGLAGAAALLLAVEMGPLQARVPSPPDPVSADPIFARAIGAAGTVSHHPPFGCRPAGPSIAAYHAFQYLALKTGALTANSVVTGRPNAPCPETAPGGIASAVARGELAFVIDAPATLLPWLTAAGIDCRTRPGYGAVPIGACHRDWSALGEAAPGFAPVPPLAGPLGPDYATGRDAIGALFLGSGFSPAEDWGAWSTGPRSVIELPSGTGGRFAHVAIHAEGYTPEARPETTAKIILEARPAPDAPWQPVATRTARYLRGGGPIVTDFEIAEAAPQAALRLVLIPEAPLSPRAAGEGADDRPLGLAVTRLTVAP